MPTKITDAPTGAGRGVSVCTLTGGSRLIDGMKLGPDGQDWDLLSREEVIKLSNGDTTFRHISNGAIPHLCAGKGTWAFQVFTSSSPHGVVFLHIRAPAKLDAIMGEGSNTLVFSGANLRTGYVSAELGSRSPRIWRRTMPKWDEIAINFCIKND
jgi:hypothetical protein